MERRKVKVTPQKIKHVILKNPDFIGEDYVLKVGTLELHFGNYRTDKRWSPSENYPMFEIDRQRTFKTQYMCKKYMLECIAKWINKNVDLFYHRTGLHEMIVNI
jgi:hypothetical protein